MTRKRGRRDGLGNAERAEREVRRSYGSLAL